MILGVLDSACQVTGNQVIKSLIRVIFGNSAKLTP